MEEIKLKPCRDCGGEAEIHVIKENGEFALSIHVRCTKCERRIAIFSVDNEPDRARQLTADTWNILQVDRHPCKMT